MHTHTHIHACMHICSQACCPGPLGHLAACLERGLNMRGHIKGSLCLCGCLECQQSTLPWWKSQVTPSEESSTSCLHMYVHLLLQHGDVILTDVPGVSPPYELKTDITSKGRFTHTTYTCFLTGNLIMQILDFCFSETGL